MNIQRFRIKILFHWTTPPKILDILHIFSRWRHETNNMEWIDLADYGHMNRGPKALLVGHTGNLCLDAAKQELGLMYLNKKGLTGSFSERLELSLQRASSLFLHLSKEPELSGCTFKANKIIIDINEKIDWPNTKENQRTLQEAFLPFWRQWFPDAPPFAPTWQALEEPCGLHIAFAPTEIASLLQNLGTTSSTQSSQSSASPILEIDNQEVQELLETNDYLYIDVRTQQEYDTLRPVGAFNIPILVQEQGQRSENTDFLDTIQKHFSKDTKLVIACKKGGRARKAAQLLATQGYSDIRVSRPSFDGNEHEPGWVQLGFSTQSGQNNDKRDYPSLLKTSP